MTWLIGSKLLQPRFSVLVGQLPLLQINTHQHRCYINSHGRLYQSINIIMPPIRKFCFYHTRYQQCFGVPIRLFTTSSILKKVKSHKTGKIKEIIHPADAEDVLDLLAVQEDMKSLVAQLQEDFSKDFRIGADLARFEQLSITVEGDQYVLSELAQITKQSPHMVTVDISSFPECIKTIEKVLRGSDLNLNPSVSGTLIKIPISSATPAHRAAVAKKAKQRSGQCKQDLRKMVSKIKDDLAHTEHISKDLIVTITNQVKIYIDHYIEIADTLCKGKQKEILKL